MPVRFKAEHLRPVIGEAMNKQCRLVLVKENDRGMYIMSERGECGDDGIFRPVAYAVGFNTETLFPEDWYRYRAADFVDDVSIQYFSPRDQVFARVLTEGFDLTVSASKARLSLYLPARSA